MNKAIKCMFDNNCNEIATGIAT